MHSTIPTNCCKNEHVFIPMLKDQGLQKKICAHILMRNITFHIYANPQVEFLLVSYAFPCTKFSCANQLQDLSRVIISSKLTL